MGVSQRYQGLMPADFLCLVKYVQLIEVNTKNLKGEILRDFMHGNDLRWDLIIMLLTTGIGE